MVFIPFHQEIQAEIEKTKAEAENLIKHVFPQRIATFKELLASPDFSDPVDTTEALQGLSLSTEDAKKSAEVVSGNPRVERLLSILKPLYVQMHTDFGLLKLWLNNMEPKIEDGNNFGADVLQHVLDRVNLMKSIAIDFTFFPTQIYEERAKAVRKAQKHPLIEEYKTVIKEMDECHIIRLQRSSQHLYRNYIMAYDVLLKNIDKVTNPRSNNSVNMY